MLSSLSTCVGGFGSEVGGWGSGFRVWRLGFRAAAYAVSLEHHRFADFAPLLPLDIAQSCQRVQVRVEVWRGARGGLLALHSSRKRLLQTLMPHFVPVCLGTERVLFIGTQFSILYTFVYSPA